ncbi:IS481 family transposase [Xanthobacter flavus]|uniref:IS481 family transposase n=1 Tax=Xanthobacter flavus TaxID=281 RepID=UPI0037269951
MSSRLHGSARTTLAIRQAIQASDERLSVLAERYGINQKTVAKWKKRTEVADLPTGPKELRSTTLSAEEEAIIIAFRRHTLLPLDDCLYALRATIPNLTRSALHRCLQRHGVSRLPSADQGAPATRTSLKRGECALGQFHLGITEVRAKEGVLYLFMAVDRTSKFVFARFLRNCDEESALYFLDLLVAVVPFRIEVVHSDATLRSCGLPGSSAGSADGLLADTFAAQCRKHGIDYRPTESAERKNGVFDEATVERCRSDNHQHLEDQLAGFISAHNFQRRLKTLGGLTPHQFIERIRRQEDQRA